MSLRRMMRQRVGCAKPEVFEKIVYLIRYGDIGIFMNESVLLGPDGEDGSFDLFFIGGIVVWVFEGLEASVEFSPMNPR